MSRPGAQRRPVAGRGVGDGRPLAVRAQDRGCFVSCPATPAEGAAVSGAGVVGRDRELAAVAAFLDAVPLGPCGLLLEGEAGIGKTTVWRAGVAWAAGRS